MQTIEYGKETKPCWWRSFSRRTWASMTIAVGLAVLLGMGFGRFYSYSICSTCGAIERDTEWQIGPGRTTFWTARSVESTPLCKLLADRQLVGDHAHTWLFGQGSGNGVRCALGPGSHIQEAAMPEGARFIAALHDYRGRESAAEWLALLLDRDRGRWTGALARSVPPDGFKDQADFDRWWRDNAVLIDIAKTEIP